MLNKITSALTTAVSIFKHEETAAVAKTSQPIPIPAEPIMQPAETFTAQMTKVAAPYNKYDSLLHKETYRPKDEEYPSWSEMLFGKQKSNFGVLRDNYLASQHQ